MGAGGAKKGVSVAPCSSATVVWLRLAVVATTRESVAASGARQLTSVTRAVLACRVSCETVRDATRRGDGMRPRW